MLNTKLFNDSVSVAEVKKCWQGWEGNYNSIIPTGQFQSAVLVLAGWVMN
jgi:hypothetical protein